MILPLLLGAHAARRRPTTPKVTNPTIVLAVLSGVPKESARPPRGRERGLRGVFPPGERLRRVLLVGLAARCTPCECVSGLVFLVCSLLSFFLSFFLDFGCRSYLRAPTPDRDQDPNDI